MSITSSAPTLLLAISIALIVTGIATYLAVLVKRNANSARYQEEKQRVQLSEIREHLEEQMAKINDRLLSDQNRWMEVNHLLRNAQDNIEQPESRKESGFLNNFLSKAGISEEDLNKNQNLIFILTPFNKRYQETYQTILGVCTNIGAFCLRGDEEFIQGNILNHILKLIAQSRVVIANIDGRNPNVLYELGIAHALGKDTIIISKNTTNLPFDVKSNRIILYNSRNDLQKKLYAELAKFNFR